MKTLSFISLCVLSVGAGYCQTPVVELDPVGASKAALDNINSNTASVKQALDELLDRANKQLTELEKQSKAMGNYLAANSASVEKARTDIQANKDTLKTNSQMVSERSALTGAEVFNDNADGSFKGIGTTVKTKAVDKDTGKIVEVTKERDKTLYTGESQKLYDIDEVNRVFDETLAEQKRLEAARLEAQIALLQTQDAVETQRLAVQIGSLDAQLIAIRQDVANQNVMREAHKDQIQLQEIVNAKAKGEASGSGAGRTQSDITAMQDKVKKLIDEMRAKSAANSAASKGDGDKATKVNARGRLP